MMEDNKVCPHCGLSEHLRDLKTGHHPQMCECTNCHLTMSRGLLVPSCRILRRHFSLTIPFTVGDYQNGKVEEAFEMVDSRGIEEKEWDKHVEHFKAQLIFKAKRLREQIRKEMKE